MPDISKCANRVCPKRNSCYRFISSSSEYWQSYTDFKFNEDGTCESFIDVNERNRKGELES